MDLAAKKVEEGDTFVYALDNIDWMEKVHDMRSDAHNNKCPCSGYKFSV